MRHGGVWKIRVRIRNSKGFAVAASLGSPSYLLPCGPNIKYATVKVSRNCRISRLKPNTSILRPPDKREDDESAVESVSTTSPPAVIFRDGAILTC